jgi:ribosomal protein L37AE/L43A
MKCLFCGKKFQGRPDKKYCCLKCGDNYINRKNSDIYKASKGVDDILFGGITLNNSRYIAYLNKSDYSKETKYNAGRNYINYANKKLIYY